MLDRRRNHSVSDVASLLRKHGVQSTWQRVAVAQVLFDHGAHLSAKDLYRLTRASGANVSKATVYNTLGVLAAKGVIREVIADPNRIFYDPNTAPHHHFYNEITGELIDIDAHDVKVTGLPRLPEGSELQGIDVIIRVRPGSAE